MARVKVCPACGEHNPPGEVDCRNCGISIIGALIEDEEILNERIETKESAEGVENQTKTYLEQEEILNCAVLEFSWGQVEIDTHLKIGRCSDFSEISDKLNEFDLKQYVSRRHAEIFLEKGLFVLRHVGKSNPTYLNGRTVKRNEKVPLADGDVIGFSRHMEAIIRFP